MSTPVLLPAGLIRLGAERLLFAVTDCLNAIGTYSRSNPRILDRAGTVIAERQIVLSCAALVAVSFDREIHARMLLQERNICLYGRLLTGAHVRLVIIAVNLPDALREHLLVGH